MPLKAPEKRKSTHTRRTFEALGRELGVDQATLEELYKAARDENELLEFKNYELQFKIQELEHRQNNRSMVGADHTKNDHSSASISSRNLQQQQQSKMIGQTQFSDATPTKNPSRRPFGKSTSGDAKLASSLAGGDNNAARLESKTTPSRSGGVMDAKSNGQSAVNDSNDLDEGERSEVHGRTAADDDDDDERLAGLLSCIVAADDDGASAAATRLKELMRCSNVIATAPTAASDGEADRTEDGLSLARSGRRKPQSVSVTDNSAAVAAIVRCPVEPTAAEEAASDVNEKRDSVETLLSLALSASQRVAAGQWRQRVAAPAGMECPSTSGLARRWPAPQIDSSHIVTSGHENANEDKCGGGGDEVPPPEAGKTNIGVSTADVACIEQQQQQQRRLETTTARPTDAIRKMDDNNQQESPAGPTNQMHHCVGQSSMESADVAACGASGDMASGESDARLSCTNPRACELKLNEACASSSSSMVSSEFNRDDWHQARSAFPTATSRQPRTGMARIALPVQRDVQASSSKIKTGSSVRAVSANTKDSTRTPQQGLATAAARKAPKNSPQTTTTTTTTRNTTPLRARSKSNLDKDSLRGITSLGSQLPRRMGSSSSSLQLNRDVQSIGPIARHATGANQPIKRSSSCLIQPTLTALSKPEIANASRENAADVIRRPVRNYKSTLAHHKQQQQSLDSNDKFVTYIPTLIEQSHATTKAKAERSITLPQDSEPAHSGRLEPVQLDIKKSSPGKVLTEAAGPPSGDDPQATRSQDDSKSAQHAATISGSPRSGEVELKEASASSHPDKLAHKQMSTTESTPIESVDGTAPKIVVEPLPNEKSRMQAGSSLSSSARETHDDEQAIFNLSMVSGRETSMLAGRFAALVAKSVDQLTTASHDGSVVASGEPRACAQCKLLYTKLDDLLREKNQLNEQLSELEEMENDSRLLSQKLAQQLASLEEQFKNCKMDLKKSCENESKWRFQNKRLHFELRQRQDCIQNLQSQLNELRSKTRALLRLQKQQPLQKVTTGGPEKSLPPKIVENEKRTGSLIGGTASNPLRESPDSLATNLVDPNVQVTSYDSAYSKSSISSSSDGCSTSGRGDSSSNNSEVDCCEEPKSVELEAAQAKQRQSAFNCADSEPCRDTDEDQRGSTGSSTYDELSDQHDEELRTIAGEPSRAADSSENKTEQTVGQAEEEKNKPAGSESLSLADSQQVQKKRISVARILRGAKVGGGNGQTASLIEELAARGPSCSSQDGPEAGSLLDVVANDELETGAIRQKALIARIECEQEHSVQAGPASTPDAAALQKLSATTNQLEGTSTEEVAVGSTEHHALATVTSASFKLNQSLDVPGRWQHAGGSLDQRAPVRKQKEARSSCELAGKSPIELALEGVSELERTTANEALQSLCMADESQAVAIPGGERKDNEAVQQEQPTRRASLTSGGVASGVTARNGIVSGSLPRGTTSAQLRPGSSCNAEGESDGLTKRQSSRQHGQQAANTGTGFGLIDGLRQEVSNLRMRLVQANTLNDNLILELKAQRQPNNANTNNDQMMSSLLEGGVAPATKGQPRQGGSVSQDASRLGCEQRFQAGEQQRRLSWSPAGASSQRSAAQQHPARCRRSSVIYVNGLNASVTHHHHHYEQQQQQQKQQQLNHHQFQQSTAPNANEHNLSAAGVCQDCWRDGQQQQQQQQSRACDLQQRQAAAVAELRQERELAEFLKFLQEKLHFHHGRTFELVSECQKLTMNALLTSYNQQISLYHHQRTVQAGNQAIKQAELVEQQRRQPGHHLIDACNRPLPPPERSTTIQSLRPPPRRRNRTLVIEQQQHWGDVGFPASEGPPTSANDTADQRASSSVTSSALQVAKQTLFSLVPIYYSCNKSQQHQQQQQPVNNNEEKINPGTATTIRRKSDADLRGPPARSDQSSTVSDDAAELRPDETNQSSGAALATASGRRVQSVSLGSGSQAFPLSGSGRQDIYATVNKSIASRGVSVLNLQDVSEAHIIHQQTSDGLDTANKVTNANQISVIESAASSRSQTTLVAGGCTVQTPEASCRKQQISPGDYQHIHQSEVAQVTGQDHHHHAIQQLQFASVKNSLSEEIERFRVHSNGQLLDLLTRQNWCESLVTEKLRAVERRHQQLSSLAIEQANVATGTNGSIHLTPKHMSTANHRLATRDHDMASNQLCVDNFTKTQMIENNISMLKKSTIYCNGIQVTQPPNLIVRQGSSSVITTKSVPNMSVTCVGLNSTVPKRIESSLDCDQQPANSFC